MGLSAAIRFERSKPVAAEIRAATKDILSPASPGRYPVSTIKPLIMAAHKPRLSNPMIGPAMAQGSGAGSEIRRAIMSHPAPKAAITGAYDPPELVKVR